MRHFGKSAVLALAILAPAIPVSGAVPASDVPRPFARESRVLLSAGELAISGLPEGMAAEPAADLREVSLSLHREPGEIEGTLRTALGDLVFHSYAIGGGLLRVEYDLTGRGRFELLVDNNQRIAEPSYPKGLTITSTDRFLFRSLGFALTREGGDETLEGVMLLRGANLWGAHPLSQVRIGRIVAPLTKSWTNLCGITSATLYHDATDHGLIGETLATGPNASNCRSRCGAGCNAILGTSAWTVDCGEHDRCEQTHPCCASCQDEFNSASDDFLFAPNCKRSGW